MWIFACKGFYKVAKKSQGPQVSWGLDVGTSVEAKLHGESKVIQRCFDDNNDDNKR